MAPAKQGSKQSRSKELVIELGEENHPRLVSEPGEGGMSSSSHSDELGQIKRTQERFDRNLEQLIAAVSNLSTKFDLLLQSRSDGLGNRVGIGTSMIRVPANDVGIDDPRQRINRDQQQEEQFLSSSSRRHHDGLLQDIHGRQQEVYPVSAGTGRPRDELLQGLHRQAQQEQTWSSGGRHQQGSVGRHQQIGGPVMTPRFGMEHVRPNAQEGFHQPVPNEDCSKLMDYCYKGILDNREGIGTPHARVFANVVDSHDQFQGIRHDFNVEEQTRSSVGRHQQGNMQSSSQLGIPVSYIGSSGGPGFGRNVSDGISPYPKAEYDATSTCGYANQPQMFGNNNANSMSTDASRSLSNSYGQSAPSSYKPSPSMMQIVPHSGQQQMEFAGSAALLQQQQHFQQQQHHFQQQLTQFSQGRPFQSLEGLKSLAAEMSESILVAEGGDFDCGTPPSKKKGFKLDKLDFNFNGPGGFDSSMNAATHSILPSFRRSMVSLKENASALGLSNSDDTPFCVLGDVMPHLKVEARPPR